MKQGGPDSDFSEPRKVIPGHGKKTRELRGGAKKIHTSRGVDTGVAKPQEALFPALKNPGGNSWNEKSSRPESEKAGRIVRCFWQSPARAGSPPAFLSSADAP
jgi:hypothetical protein